MFTLNRICLQKGNSSFASRLGWFASRLGVVSGITGSCFGPLAVKGLRGQYMKKISLWSFLGLLVVFTTATLGCSGEVHQDESDAASVQVKTQEVSAATGTVFAVSDGENAELAGARLVIPPNSLAADTTITLSFVDDSIADAGDVSAGPAALFEPKGIRFTKGASLTLPYALGAEQSAGELFLTVLEDDGSRQSLRVLSTGDGFATATISGFTRFQPTTGGRWSGCVAHDDCEEAEPCDCEAGEACVAGLCCPDADGNGNCDPGAPDPCEEITCAVGQYCLGGQCTCPDVVCSGDETFDPDTCTCGTKSACEGAACPAGHKCTVDPTDNTARCKCPSGDSPDASGNCQSTCNCGPDQFCGEMGACICVDGTPADRDGRCGAPCDCPDGQICTASGACVCPDGKIMVDGSCTAGCNCPAGLICSGNGTCVCPDGTTASTDGSCGTSCVCPDGLICASDGTCICPDGSVTDTTGACGSSCTCEPPLVCTSNGACACPDGSIVDTAGDCGATCTCPYDLVCTSSGACACPDGTRVHPDTGCGESICDCPAPLVCASGGDCLCPDGSTINTSTGECGSSCNCPTDQICTAEGGCTDSHTEPTCTCTTRNGCCDGCFVINEGGTCSDGTFCNGTEICSAGSCGGGAGNPCLDGPECGNICDEHNDTCNLGIETPCTDDDNLCTDDMCNGLGACIHPNNSVSCDDGVFCNGADNCSGGLCVSAGDPCTGGEDCADVCNEDRATCNESPETPCTDDGDQCTFDMCDGEGACIHPSSTTCSLPPCSASGGVTVTMVGLSGMPESGATWTESGVDITFEGDWGELGEGMCDNLGGPSKGLGFGGSLTFDLTGLSCFVQTVEVTVADTCPQCNSLETRSGREVTNTLAVTSNDTPPFTLGSGPPDIETFAYITDEGTFCTVTFR